MNAIDLSELDRRLRAGDDSALAEAFESCRDRLARLVRLRLDPRLLGRLDPEDVLQEGWLSAARRLDHFRSRDGASLFLWLRMIVVQALTDATRRHLATKKRDAGAEERGVASHAGNPTSLAGRLLSRLTSPTRAAVRAELAERIEGVLAGMSELDQEILVLRHFEELTNQETAEALGLHKSAATQRYLRALRRLESILSAQPGLRSAITT